MSGENKERWRELCEQVAVEQDPKKLVELTPFGCHATRIELDFKLTHYSFLKQVVTERRTVQAPVQRDAPDLVQSYNCSSRLVVVLRSSSN
jgi:transposase